MFNKKQVDLIFERYCQRGSGKRGEMTFPHRGILLFEKAENQRFDFGVLEKKSGDYIYPLECEELLPDDILEFFGESFLIEKPQKVYFGDEALY
ncbi:MAG: hypothetical protein RR048_02230, partial [Oscillospiraceae bacterium]